VLAVPFVSIAVGDFQRQDLSNLDVDPHGRDEQGLHSHKPPFLHGHARCSRQMRADPDPLAAPFPAHHQAPQRAQRTVIVHKLGQDLRPDHRAMTAGLAVRPDDLLPCHGVAQAGGRRAAHLRRQSDESGVRVLRPSRPRWSISTNMPTTSLMRCGSRSGEDRGAAEGQADR